MSELEPIISYWATQIMAANFEKSMLERQMNLSLGPRHGFEALNSGLAGHQSAAYCRQKKVGFYTGLAAVEIAAGVLADDIGMGAITESTLTLPDVKRFVRDNLTGVRSMEDQERINRNWPELFRAIVSPDTREKALVSAIDVAVRQFQTLPGGKITPDVRLLVCGVYYVPEEVSDLEAIARAHAVWHGIPPDNVECCLGAITGIMFAPPGLDGKLKTGFTDLGDLSPRPDI